MYVETVAQIAVKVNARDGYGKDGGWVMAIYLFFARLTQFRVNKRVAGKTSSKGKRRQHQQQQAARKELLNTRAKWVGLNNLSPNLDPQLVLGACRLRDTHDLLNPVRRHVRVIETNLESAKWNYAYKVNARRKGKQFCGNLNKNIKV